MGPWAARAMTTAIDSNALVAPWNEDNDLSKTGAFSPDLIESAAWVLIACYARIGRSGRRAFRPRRYRLLTKTSAGSLKRLLNFRTCSKVSFRCPARNMETALSDPNSGTRSRCVGS